MRLEQLDITRPDADGLLKQLEALAENIRSAADVQTCLAAFREADALNGDFSSRSTFAVLRFYLNMNDETLAAESAWYDTPGPLVEEAFGRVLQALGASPFRQELDRALGPMLLRMADARSRLLDPALTALRTREAALVQQYMTLTGSAMVRWDGEEVPLSSMGAFLADTDRDRRRAAMQCQNGWYDDHRETLHALFDELLQNRTEQARTLGFANYTDMRYATRLGFGRKEIEDLRRRVRAEWSPLVCEVKEAQRKRLGVETFRMYDSPLRFPDGNPRLLPQGEAFVAQAAEMFRQMSPVTGDYFDELRRDGLMDLFDRPGKAPYHAADISLQAWDTDFILGHFTGDQMDLECLVHEFGHALASRRAARSGRPYCLREPGQEIAETHSLSMELLTAPWWGMFFSPADVKKNCRKKLEYNIYFLSAIVMNDELQHRFYDAPGMTWAERDACCEELYRAYNPYADLSDLPFAGWSAMWQDMTVLYAQPFYMIDYALAQLLAMQLYTLSLTDWAGAMEKYLRFLDLSGTMDITDLAHACGLLSPFDPECLDTVLAGVRAQLKDC